MIGERLADLRQDAGLSQKELAEKLSISHHTVSSYERDISTPNDEIKMKIAQLFNISLDYLLGLINTPFSYTRDKDIIQLPSNIPNQAKDEVLQFIDYIKAKYNL